MKTLRYLLILFGLVTLPALSFGAPPPAGSYDGIVLGRYLDDDMAQDYDLPTTSSGRRTVMNPFRIFPNNTIRYNVRGTVPLNVNGQTINFDIANDVYEALYEWVEASNFNLSVERVNDDTEADLIFLGDDRPITSRAVAATAHLIGTKRQMITMRAVNFNYLLNPDTANSDTDRSYWESKLQKILDATGNVQNDLLPIVEMIFRVTLKHEIGHALGLDHPDYSANENGLNNDQTVMIVHWMNPQNPPGVAIMGAEIGDFFQNLRANLGRPVTARDIQIPIQEANAIRLFNEGCGDLCGISYLINGLTVIINNMK